MEEMLINGHVHYVQLILNYYVKMEQEKQLKKLLVEQKKKTNDLKRLKAEQTAKKRAREIKKVIERAL